MGRNLYYEEEVHTDIQYGIPTRIHTYIVLKDTGRVCNDMFLPYMGVDMFANCVQRHSRSL